MHTNDIPATGSKNINDLVVALEGRERDHFPLPTSLVSVNPATGHITIDGTDREATSLAVRQLCRFADVPAGWAIRSTEEKVAEAINVGLQNSKTESLSITVEDSRVVSFLQTSQINPPTNEVLQEVETLIEKRGFELDRWSHGNEGHAIRLLVPYKAVEPKVGDVVEAGVDFLSFENAKRGLDVFGVLHRLVCTNGAVATEMDEDMSMVKGMVKIESAADQIMRAALMVDSSLAMLERVMDTMAVLTTIPLPDIDAESLYMSNFFRWAGLSVRLQDELLYALSEEEQSMWGLYNAITRVGRDTEDRILSLRWESAGFAIATNPHSALAALTGSV